MRAYIFPGQGAQFTGMGKDLYENSPLAREYFEKANEILGYRITDLMFEGTSEDFDQTKVTHPAVFLHSVISAIALGNKFKPDMVAGHSLGEFSALVAAGALTFEEGLRLVYARAMAMQKACEKEPSTMAAVLGLDDETVEEVCDEVNKEYIVVAANYNSPGQLVISGSIEGIDKAIMQTHFNAPSCPVYQNVNANPQTDPESIKKNLIAQLTAPVRWTQTVKNMINDGADEFIELGPGDVLKGLVKKVNPDIITG